MFLRELFEQEAICAILPRAEVKVNILNAHDDLLPPQLYRVRSPGRHLQDLDQHAHHHCAPREVVNQKLVAAAEKSRVRMLSCLFVVALSNRGLESCGLERKAKVFEEMCLPCISP